MLLLVLLNNLVIQQCFHIFDKHTGMCPHTHAHTNSTHCTSKYYTLHFKIKKKICHEYDIYTVL